MPVEVAQITKLYTVGNGTRVSVSRAPGTKGYNVTLLAPARMSSDDFAAFVKGTQELLERLQKEGN